MAVEVIIFNSQDKEFSTLRVDINEPEFEPGNILRTSCGLLHFIHTKDLRGRYYHAHFLMKES